MRLGSTFPVSVVAWALVVVASHVLGATLFPASLWGAHFYRFFPAWVLALAMVLLLLGIGWALRSRWAPPASSRPSRWGFLLPALATVAAPVLFWWLRIQHPLLGDAGVLSHNLALGESTHPRQPLALLVHQFFHGMTGPWFAGAGREARDIAFDTAALEAVLAGALFVPIAFGLAQRILSPGRDEGDVAPGPAAAVAAILMVQGYGLLFFGYVENYTWFLLALGLYLWAGMSFLSGRTPLAVAAVALVVAIGLNLAGVVLVPTWIVLVGFGLARTRGRADVVLGIVALVAALVALDRLLAATGGEARGGLLYIWDLVARGSGGGSTFRELMSPDHLRDFFNIHLLIGPCAGLLLLAVGPPHLLRGGWRDPTTIFLVVAALPALAASWMLGDPLQGFVRDWDLFAPFGLIYAVGVLHAWRRAAAAPETLRRCLWVMLGVSLFHTGAWVAINRSTERSLERFKTASVTRGRNEFYVGYWYLQHRHAGEARDWFERSIARYPANNSARYYLALLDMGQGQFDRAAEHLREAIRARPDRTSYRLAFVDASVLAGRPQDALPELEHLLHEQPGNATWWAGYGIVLQGLGRGVEAREAFSRARDLAPGEVRFERLLARVDQPDAFLTALRDDWDALILPADPQEPPGP